jgi:hypothetical protein
MAETTESVNETAVLGVQAESELLGVASGTLPCDPGGLRLIRLPLIHGPGTRFLRSGSAERAAPAFIRREVKHGI